MQAKLSESALTESTMIDIAKAIAKTSAVSPEDIFRLLFIGRSVDAVLESVRYAAFWNVSVYAAYNKLMEGGK